ncbi:hypothetical protein L218DRAFT_991689 [Marasmius fiardii PR-910]|nr:hypothetical protein L218DRAFT_991689 [Marasmius fiardii PR-910]
MAEELPPKNSDKTMSACHHCANPSSEGASTCIPAISRVPSRWLNYYWPFCFWCLKNILFGGTMVHPITFSVLLQYNLGPFENCIVLTSRLDPNNFQWSAFLHLSSLFSPSDLPSPDKRDVAKIKANIATILSEITVLDSIIVAFPSTGGSPTATLTIHSLSGTLYTSFKQATTDTTNTPPFNEVEAQNTFASAPSNESAIKTAFHNLPIGGIAALILQDLRHLHLDSLALFDAKIARCPVDLLQKCNKIRLTIGPAFATAITAYSM